MRFLIVSIEPQGLTELLNCFVRFSNFHQTGSQIIMNYRIIGLNSHRSPVGSDRIRHIALFGESVTESEGEIIISVSVFGVNCKGLPEIDNSVIQLPFFHQDVAEIIIDTATAINTLRPPCHLVNNSKAPQVNRR